MEKFIFVVVVVITKQCQLLMTILFMKLETFLYNSNFLCAFFNGKVGQYAIKITFCYKKERIKLQIVYSSSSQKDDILVLS